MKELTKAEKKKEKRQERKAEKQKLISEKKKKEGMKKVITYSISAILLISIISFFYWQSQQAPKYEGFANCLTENGFIMAGTDWCSSCQKQKAMFGKAFSSIEYKNCDIYKDWCTEKRVSGYPTWILPDGSAKKGIQQLKTLSELSECSLK